MDIAYQLVFFKVPDPYQENFALSKKAELLEKEWEPKLTDLRKAEYSSSTEVSEIDSKDEFVAAYSKKSYALVDA